MVLSFRIEGKPVAHGMPSPARSAATDGSRLMMPLIRIGWLLVQGSARVRLVKNMLNQLGHIHPRFDHLRREQLKAILWTAAGVSPAAAPAHVGIEFASGHKGSFRPLLLPFRRLDAP